MTYASPVILLLGSDAALLEGLSQSLSALGYALRVARELHEASEIAAAEPPLIVLAASQLAGEAGSDLLRVRLAAGGARVLYHSAGDEPATLLGSVQRSVLADLALPLERHRLVALIQHVVQRSEATGRPSLETPPEQRAP